MVKGSGVGNGSDSVEGIGTLGTHSEEPGISEKHDSSAIAQAANPKQTSKFSHASCWSKSSSPGDGSS